MRCGGDPSLVAFPSDAYGVRERRELSRAGGRLPSHKVPPPFTRSRAGDAIDRQDKVMHSMVARGARNRTANGY
jgi:hypothetical protein